MPWRLLFGVSIGRKLLVALPAAFLAVFVLGHMIGNLQVFLGPDTLNRYAHDLQTLPYGILWIIRAVVLAAFLAHVWFAMTLHARNRRARARGYAQDRWLAARTASRMMMLGGMGLLAFVVFHILHLTARVTHDFGAVAEWPIAGRVTMAPNVYAMMYVSFSHWPTALAYVLGAGLVAAHLSHGVASVFQSIGWSVAPWRARLQTIARGYGLIVFLGLASIPVAVLLDAHLGVAIFDRAALPGGL